MNFNTNFSNHVRTPVPFNWCNFVVPSVYDESKSYEMQVINLYKRFNELVKSLKMNVPYLIRLDENHTTTSLHVKGYVYLDYERVDIDREFSLQGMTDGAFYVNIYNSPHACKVPDISDNFVYLSNIYMPENSTTLYVVNMRDGIITDVYFNDLYTSMHDSWDGAHTELFEKVYGAILDGDAIVMRELTAEIIRAKNAEAALAENIQNEVERAMDAESVLQSNIDTVENESKLRDESLSNRINIETSARQGADHALDDKITAEVNARKLADSELKGDYQNLVAAERTERVNADSVLQGKLDVEKAQRESADTQLSGMIITETFDRITELAAETTARISAVNAEAGARVLADNALGARIDSEAQSRIAADTAEATARATADVALGSRVDAEINSRIAGDNLLSGRMTVYEHALDDERHARESADIALNTSVTALSTNKVDKTEFNSSQNAQNAIISLNTQKINGHETRILALESGVVPSANLITSLDIIDEWILETNFVPYTDKDYTISYNTVYTNQYSLTLDLTNDDSTVTSIPFDRSANPINFNSTMYPELLNCLRFVVKVVCDNVEKANTFIADGNLTLVSKDKSTNELTPRVVVLETLAEEQNVINSNVTRDIAAVENSLAGIESDLNSKISATDSRVNDAESVSADLNIRLEAVESDMVNRNDFDTLDGRVGTLETDLFNVQGTLDTLESNIDSLEYTKASNSEFLAHVEISNTEHAETTNHINNLYEIVDRHSGSINNSVDIQTFNQLNSTVIELSEDTTAHILQSDARITANEQDIVTLGGNVANLSSEISGVRGIADSALALARRNEGDILTLYDDGANVQHQLNEMSGDISTVYNGLSESVEQIHALQAAIRGDTIVSDVLVGGLVVGELRLVKITDTASMLSYNSQRGMHFGDFSKALIALEFNPLEYTLSSVEMLNALSSKLIADHYDSAFIYGSTSNNVDTMPSGGPLLDKTYPVRIIWNLATQSLRISSLCAISSATGGSGIKRIVRVPSFSFPV